ncbi:MAG: hypothetical protein JWN17_2883 [Frankiales bacterium]|nr:hypothetical protein [Frankiales bacterium]
MTVPATVRTYDAATRSGDLLRDDGRPLRFDAAALDPRVRSLRPGQRVHCRLGPDDVVVAVVLAGLSPLWPLPST